MGPSDVAAVQYVLLCAIPVVSLGYAWFFRGRQSIKEAGASFFVVVVAWVLTLPAFITYCGHRENPINQTLITLGGAIVVGLAVGDRRSRWTGIGVLFGLFLFLMITYSGAVHGALYVGTPRASGIPPDRIVPEWHTRLTNMYRVRASGPGGCGEGRQQAPAS
jgi:hypothetical protein